MATIELGPLVTGIRGTISGTLYSANKSGPYARAWSKGPNPRTARQTTQRAILSGHGTEWAALAQADRDDWDTYAALPAQELFNSLGVSYYASGWNWYCRINNHLASTGSARRDTFPTNARPAMPTTNSFTCQTPIIGDWNVYLTVPVNQFTGYQAIIYLAFGPSEAQVWKSRGYLLVEADTQDTTSLLRFGTGTLAAFGDPILNSKAFITIQRQEPHGQRSAPNTNFCTVTPLP